MTVKPGLEDEHESSHVYVQLEGPPAEGADEFALRGSRFVSDATERSFNALVFNSHMGLHVTAWVVVVGGDLYWWIFNAYPVHLLPVVLLDVACLITRLWLHALEDQLRAHRIGARMWLAYMPFSTASLIGDLGTEAVISGDAVAFWTLLIIGVVILNGTHGLSSRAALLTYALMGVDAAAGMWTEPALSTYGPTLLMTWLLSVAVSTAAVRQYIHQLRTSHSANGLARYHEGQARFHAAETVDAQRRLVDYLFHELRNDQNAQMGALRAVAEDAAALPPETSSLVDEALVHAQHGSTMITSMLDYSKMRAGKLKLTSVAFELRELLDSSILLVRHLARAKTDLALEAAVVGAPPGARVELIGARQQLQQVLLNLLTNAVKYTESGHVRLVATLLPSAALDAPGRSVPPNEVLIRFAVEDTGCGIPTELAGGKLFAAFEQGPKPGTGLGLPLCNQFLGLMGGQRLEHAPREGGGTVFSFALPLARAPSTATPPAAGRAAAAPACEGPPAPQPTVPAGPPLPAGPPPPAAPLNVLIADDVLINRKLLKRSLEQALAPASVHFEEAATGEAALELLLNGPTFSLAFLDENYTATNAAGGHDGLTGTEVTRAYRSFEYISGRPRRLVIVGVTGNAQPATHDKHAQAIGQDAVWAKPQPSVEQMRAWLVVLLSGAR